MTAIPNDFPDVLYSSPVDADAWFNAIAQWVTYLKNSLRFVDDLTDTTSNNATGGTEAISSSITFEADVGVNYKITYQGVSESTVAADIATVQLRWQNSAAPSTAGVSIASTNKTASAASKGDGFSLTGRISGQASGDLTVTATIKRIVGTGQVKQNGNSAGQQLYWLVEAYGGTPS